jgi:hypothetical protein
VPPPPRRNRSAQSLAGRDALRRALVGLAAWSQPPVNKDAVSPGGCVTRPPPAPASPAALTLPAIDFARCLCWPLVGDKALDLVGLGVSRAGELLRMTWAKEAWVAMGGEKSDSESE